MLERRIFEDQGVIAGVKFCIVNTQLTVTEQCVRSTANLAIGAITITLPPVGQAKGKLYGIMALDAGPVNTVTIQDKDDSEEWGSDITLNGGGEGALLYSDGRRWWKVVTDTTGTGEPDTQAPTTAAG